MIAKRLRVFSRLLNNVNFWTGHQTKTLSSSPRHSLGNSQSKKTIQNHEKGGAKYLGIGFSDDAAAPSLRRGGVRGGGPVGVDRGGQCLFASAKQSGPTIVHELQKARHGTKVLQLHFSPKEKKHFFANMVHDFFCEPYTMIGRLHRRRQNWWGRRRLEKTWKMLKNKHWFYKCMKKCK